MSLRLRGGRAADGRLVDVACEDGLIASVAVHDPAARAGEAGDESEVVELGGRLLLPATAEPHAHLDKALTADEVPNPAGDLAGAIDAWRSHYSALTTGDIVDRAHQAVLRLVAHGCTAIRTHADVGERIGLMSVEALREARNQVGHLAELQLVALVASPLTGVEGAGNRAAMAAAIEAGVDLVGGCPHLDPDPAGLIDVVLDAARDAALPADLHVDETLDTGMLSLDLLARRVLDRGHPYPVTASHCVSLGVQRPQVQAATARIVAEARIGIVVLPQTNLFLQARDHEQSPPRGLTAVAALQAAGVLVAAGADNLQDPFCAVGRGDPLETAALVVMAAHRTPDVAFDLVTNAARRLMGLAPVELVAGSPAELMALEATSIRDAVASAHPARLVVHEGRVVVDSTLARTWTSRP